VANPAGSFAQKANVDFILPALMTSGDDGSVVSASL
jgi:hypothetical protein